MSKCDRCGRDWEDCFCEEDEIGELLNDLKVLKAENAAMKSENEALRQQVDALVKAVEEIKPYVEHDEKCYGYLVHNKCNCGLDKTYKILMSAIQAAKAATDGNDE